MTAKRERRDAHESNVLRFSGIAIGSFLLLPVVFIVFYSFQSGIFFTLLPSGFSVKWFSGFFASATFRRALWTSLSIAGSVTPLCCLIAVPTALALVRGNFPGREVINAFLLSPIIVPGVVTGIAFLSLFSRTDSGSSFLRLIIAMTCFALPFAVRSVVANLHGLPTVIEEAARDLGASPRQLFFHVILPQLRPGLLAGAIFVFVEAIDNFSIAVFLTDSRTTTLPVEAYSYIRDFDDPTVAAMATLLIALSTGLLFLAERVIGLEGFLRLN
jgi:putative spermidine/putrescine transport system permease protein